MRYRALVPITLLAAVLLAAFAIIAREFYDGESEVEGTFSKPASSRKARHPDNQPAATVLPGEYPRKDQTADNSASIRTAGGELLLRIVSQDRIDGRALKESVNNNVGTYNVVDIETNAWREFIRDSQSMFETQLTNGRVSSLEELQSLEDPPRIVVEVFGRRLDVLVTSAVESHSGWSSGHASMTGVIDGEIGNYVSVAISPESKVKAVFTHGGEPDLLISPINGTAHHLVWEDLGKMTHVD